METRQRGRNGQEYLIRFPGLWMRLVTLKMRLIWVEAGMVRGTYPWKYHMQFLFDTRISHAFTTGLTPSCLGRANSSSVNPILYYFWPALTDGPKCLGQQHLPQQLLQQVLPQEWCGWPLRARCPSWEVQAQPRMPAPRRGVSALTASLGHSFCSIPKHDVTLELQHNLREFFPFLG